MNETIRKTIQVVAAIIFDEQGRIFATQDAAGGIKARDS